MFEEEYLSQEDKKQNLVSYTAREAWQESQNQQQRWPKRLCEMASLEK
jgi:hypothetical protein